MNYIWFPLVEAIRLGYDTTKIHYRVKDKKYLIPDGDVINYYTAGSHNMSPWLEYIPHILYDPYKTVKTEVRFAHIDINPYHRFGFIFDTILNPERSDTNDLIVCDIITHMLAHIDRVCGMSKRDFQLMLIMNEIDSGCFGGKKNTVQLFNSAEKREIAENLIMLYETSNSVRCLEYLFTMIMTDFTVLSRDNEEIVFWNPNRFDGHTDEKLSFIIDLFLPVDFPYVVHWQHSYGVIEHEESMILEEFVL